MEENTFLDYNPQYGAFPQGGTAADWDAHAPYTQARNSEVESNVFQRWFNPGITEGAQFDRENFLMDKENAFNEYMWNKTNEYNSAEAQMERAKAAGINPNLAAAGIMGQGTATAVPMQGAKGDVGMNQNAANPIETLGTGVNAIATGIGATKDLGELLGFGAKNNAEIKFIKNNASKVAEEMKYTRRQRKQLEAIGEVLVNNARAEGKQIEQNIENLKELNELYKKQQANTEADTNLLNEKTGTEIENRKSIEYDNFRKQFEKEIRDMLGVEVTHQEMAMLIEAFTTGHGEQIINYFVDTLAGAGKAIRKLIEGAFTRENQKPEPVTTTNQNTGQPTKIEFKNKTEKRRWQRDNLKHAKYIWEHTSKKRGQSFDNYLKIYCSQRGIKVTDLLNE